MPQKKDNHEQFFNGQQPGENVICFFRKHWITILPHIVSIVVFIFLTLIFFFNIDNLFETVPNTLSKILFILTAGLSLLFIHYFYLKIVQHFFTMVIVTNYRIIALSKTLFMTDDEEAFDLRMVQEINKHQNGLIPNLLQYGDLSITLTQSSAILRLQYIPNPNHCFHTITKVKQENIEDRMRRKIDMRQARSLEQPDKIE